MNSLPTSGSTLAQTVATSAQSLGSGWPMASVPPPAMLCSVTRLDQLSGVHEWLAFKTRDSKILEADLDDIFAKFGEHYRLTF
jgi:hypothetical protein